ncbi:MAG: cellulase family glycosylhydrolase [Firmicutes bacterium]|nr:cellulase family glycosylhydrolase [Bacillota bacterium]
MSTRQKFYALILVLLIVFPFAASLGGCSSAKDIKPTDVYNPWYYEINQQANSVNVKLPWTKGIGFDCAENPVRHVFMHCTEQDFIDLKKMGVETIRLAYRPFMESAGGAPEWKLNQAMLRVFDRYVEWAEKHEMYFIIDFHNGTWVQDEFGYSNDPSKEKYTGIHNPEGAKAMLSAVWRQIALRYKHTSKYIIYEILNEPSRHNFPTEHWTQIQAEALAAIKTIDPLRTVIVTGTSGDLRQMTLLPKYPYENVIYTFHFYTPDLFTHQGANWGNESRADVKDMPFPAAAATPLSPILGESYKQQATVQYLEQWLDTVVEFANTHNVPIFAGEFGVIRNAPQADRVRYYEILTRLFEIRGISWAHWGYRSTFGIFDTANAQHIGVYRNINTDIAKALRLNPLEQGLKQNRSFDIFYGGTRNSAVVGTLTSNNGTNNTTVTAVDLTKEYADGKYAMELKNLGTNGAVTQNFVKDIDWRHLVENGYALVLRAKSDRDIRFQARFSNPEEQGEVWYSRYEIRLTASDEWQTVTIPLSDFQDFTRSGQTLFSWDKVVDRLRFIAAYNTDAGGFSGNMTHATVLIDYYGIIGNDPQEPQFPAWAWILIGTVAVLGGVLTVLCITKSRKVKPRQRTIKNQARAKN